MWHWFSHEDRMNLMPEYRRFCVLGVIVSATEHRGSANITEIIQRLVNYDPSVRDSMYPHDVKVLSERGFVEKVREEFVATKNGIQFYNKKKYKIFQIENELRELE